MSRIISTTSEAELLARGNLTLPKALRDAHDLKAGTRFTVIDLGAGTLMLGPRRLRVDTLAGTLRDAPTKEGETLESLLAHLDSQRGRPAGMTRSTPEVFLDSIAVLAAILSSTGGARQILRLGKIGQVRLRVSGAVLAEVERTLREKLPSELAALALWLDAAGVSVVAAPRKAAVTRLQTWLAYAPDTLVLAAAVSAGVDHFVTLDRRHFLGNAPLRAGLPFPIGTPGDYLGWHRARVATEE